MSLPAVVWIVARAAISPGLYTFARLSHYGSDRIPRFGGAVLALNHFSWLDTAAFGTASPRMIFYMAKVEAHETLGLGQLIRAFGSFSVRRGESDREAVRTMRQVVRDGHLLGLFVEGTRQRSGTPGTAQPGAAMVAIQEGVPVVAGAIDGTQRWRFGNFKPVTLAWGEPMRFHNFPRNAKGYREATAEIEREIHRLWRFCVEMNRLGRPDGVPPR